MSTVERVIFLQGEQSAEFFSVLDAGGESEALLYLMQWHYPGEHETASEPGHGSADDTYTRDGYTLAYNRALEYAGLEFETAD